MSLHTRTSHAGLRTLLPALLLSLLAFASAYAQPQPGARAAAATAPAPASNQTAPSEPDANTPRKETPAPAPTPYKLTVGAVSRPDGKTEDGFVVAGIDDQIKVKVNHLREEVDRRAALGGDETRLDTTALVLFLDDIEMKGLHPQSVDLQNNEVTFKLNRDENTKKTWNDLLSQPKAATRPAKVGVGPQGQPAWDVVQNPAQKFKLRVYEEWRLNLYTVLFIIGVIGFLLLAWKKDIIRDSQPPNPVGGKRPYSLARTQIAWWSIVIFGSFLFIWLVTNDYNTLTSSSLVLLGIGTGTALGSALVDSNKQESATKSLLTLKPRQMKLAEQTQALKDKVAAAEAKLAATPPAITPEESAGLSGWRVELATKGAELEQLNKEVADVESAQSRPISENIIADLLSDANGVTIHRLQIVVWTVLLGIIFLRSVWLNLQMPEFDSTLLGLMGISGATYVGFKIPERQTEPGPQPEVPSVPPPPPPGSLPGAGPGPELGGGGGQPSLPPGGPNPPAPPPPPPANETPGSVPVNEGEVNPNSELINTPAEEVPTGELGGEGDDASGDVKLGGDDAAAAEGDASLEEAIGADIEEDTGGEEATKS